MRFNTARKFPRLIPLDCSLNNSLLYVRSLTWTLGLLVGVVKDSAGTSRKRNTQGLPLKLHSVSGHMSSPACAVPLFSAWPDCCFSFLEHESVHHSDVIPGSDAGLAFFYKVVLSIWIQGKLGPRQHMTIPLFIQFVIVLLPCKY